MEVELEENIKRGKLEQAKQTERFDDLVKKKLNEKPRIRKTEKPAEIPKEKKSQVVNIENLVESFKGTLVTDKEIIEYTNFRYPESKRILFYCIGRKNFITVSTKNNSMASGWKSQRLTSKEDLKAFVDLIKTQVGGEN